MAYENKLVDKRVVTRNIEKGLVDPVELKKQIDGLPDSEPNLVHVSVEGQSDDDDDDFLDDEDEDEDEDEDGQADLDQDKGPDQD